MALAQDLEAVVLGEVAALHLPKPSFATDELLDQLVRDKLKENREERVEDEYIHPHTYGRWCRRREVLRRLQRKVGIPTERMAPAPASLLTFEAGHACHAHLRDRLIGHMLVGYWKCGRCGSRHGYKVTEDGSIIHEAFMFRPSECKNCKLKPSKDSSADTLHYVEFAMTHEASNQKGTCDGLIFHRGHLRIAELKSEDPQLWLDRAGPSLGHGMQGSAYAQMINALHGAEVAELLKGLNSPKSIIDTINVIYVNKSSYRIKSYIADAKVYWNWTEVERRAVATALEKYKDITSEGLYALETDLQFNNDCAKVCAHRDVAMAKSCPSRKVCFASTFKKKGK